MLDVPYMKKILILAANPRKDLNLDREIRDLKRVIESSAHGDSFQVINEPAVRVSDLQDLLFKHRPQIVHFCGHGGGEAGLVFESDLGREQQVKTEALSELFRLFDDGVECVLLNACYSQDQAEAIVQHIGHVIGMNQEIRDDAAIAFSKGFYRALGYDCSIKEAFEFGKNAIQLEISGSSVVRSGATAETRKLNIANAVTIAIPEHLKPILKTNPQAAAAHSQAISQEKRTEIQLELEQILAQARASIRPSAPPQAVNRKTRWILGGSAIGLLILGGVGSRFLGQRNPQIYIQKAQAEIQSKNYSAAQVHLNQAIKLDGRLAAPHCLMAQIHDALQQQQQAVNEWNRCADNADLNPSEQAWGDMAQENLEAVEAINETPELPKSPSTAPSTASPTVSNRDQQDLEKAQKWIYEEEEYRSALYLLKDISEDSPLIQQNQYKYLVKVCSEKILARAESYYNDGEIDDALADLKIIPPKSSNYPKVQTLLNDWKKEKDAFDQLKSILANDKNILAAQAILQQIKNQALLAQAQADINKIKETGSLMPSASPNPPSSAEKWEDYKYAWLSKRDVTEEDLKNKPDSELTIMRNSVYAKYGFIFGPEKLKLAFRQESWYKPTKKQDEVAQQMTRRERVNAAKIKDWQEKQKKSLPK
jgi:hypothetical protein